MIPVMSTTSIAVLDHADAVAAALGPLRRQMLALLEQPHSASSLARELGLPRQKVNYHLRRLEQHGLVRLVDVRPRRGLNERLFQAIADHMLIDPELLSAPDPSLPFDRYAAEHLALTAARAVHDIGSLLHDAAAAGQRLATFTLDGEITFATPDDLRGFAEALGSLVARYDRPDVPGGRPHRFIAMSHPTLAEEQPHDRTT